MVAITSRKHPVLRQVFDVQKYIKMYNMYKMVDKEKINVTL